MWRLKISEGEDDPWVKSRNSHVGRQFWEFDATAKECSDHHHDLIQKARRRFHANRFTKKHSSDLLMRFQFASEEYNSDDDDDDVEDGEVSEVVVVERALAKGITMFSKLQTEDGFWPADYGGPLFLLPALVIGLYVTGALHTVLTHHHRSEMCRYIHNHQNEDGGWGLHIEGKSTMFCTALSYVAVRLLDGESSLAEARRWILRHGGAQGIPSWGKMWLSVLGVYDWRGNNPVPPELWLLPYTLNPLHPGRMWCHTRMVYLPISYLFATRFVGPITPAVARLRAELYTVPYHAVDWDAARNMCSDQDLLSPEPNANINVNLRRVLWGCLHHVGEPVLKKWPFSKLRERALQAVMRHVHSEDSTTNYVCLGPVNKVLNMICCFAEDPGSEPFERHLSRVKDYLWLAEDGMKMQGYNGSQLWDVSLAVQAFLSSSSYSSALPRVSSVIRRASSFIEKTQIWIDFTDLSSQCFRHISKGGWSFSTPDSAWPVSDCTASALHALLGAGSVVDESRLHNSVHLLLSLQNPSGGFASYELTRSYAFLEVLNPVQVFSDVMIDYQYVECTSSVVQALQAFKKAHPGHRAKEIQACVEKAASFIESLQLRDGSWYGSWGICFTYATWFGIKALVAAGRTYLNSESLRRACHFLLSKQLPNSGGWGESYLSCQNKVYTNLEGDKPHLVNTSWAMLSLIQAGQTDRDPAPLHRAAKLLVSSQMKNGEFPQQEIMGVFNKTCMISYSNYRNIFPIWALGEYLNRVLLRPDSSHSCF